MTRRSFQHGAVFRRNGKWVIRWRERMPGKDGHFVWKQRAETLESTATMTKAEARTILRERLSELDVSGQFHTRDTTFQELATRWESDSLPNKSRATQHGYMQLLNQRLLPFFGPYRLRDLQPSIVQRFVQRLIEESLAPQTVRNAYNTFRAILKFGRKLKYLKENPADGVELPTKKDKHERSVAARADVARIMHAFEERRDNTSVLIVQLAYMTGLRKGEIEGLKWKDIDFVQNEIRPVRAVWRGPEDWEGVEVPLKSPSSYKPLPLAPKLRELLLSRRAQAKRRGDDEYVFATADGKPATLANWERRKLYPLEIDLKLPQRITLHSLRHSHSTDLNELGVDPKTLQSQMRHADAKLTLTRYTHQIAEAQRQAVADLEKQLLSTRVEACCSQLFPTQAGADSAAPASA